MDVGHVGELLEQAAAMGTEQSEVGVGRQVRTHDLEDRRELLHRGLNVLSGVVATFITICLEYAPDFGHRDPHQLGVHRWVQN